MSDLKAVMMPAKVADRIMALRQEGYSGVTPLHWIGGEVKTLKIPRPDEEVRA